MIKKSCVIYDSWAELIENLPDEMAGELIKMVLGYAFGEGCNNSENQAINAIFAMIRTKIDEDMDAYQETIRQRSEAGRKGMSKRWADNKTITNDNEVITNDNGVITHDNNVKQDVTNITVSVSDSVSVSDKDIKEKDKKEKRFVKPSVDEVRTYCEERHNNVDPDTFIDFYESKGWKVGNQSMKDWKACVRTWEKRGSPRTKPSDNPKIHNYSERDYDFDELQKLAVGGKP